MTKPFLLLPFESEAAASNFADIVNGFTIHTARVQHDKRKVIFVLENHVEDADMTVEQGFNELEGFLIRLEAFKSPRQTIRGQV